MADAIKARNTKKVPDSLYDLCLVDLVTDITKFKCKKNDHLLLPDTVLADLYFKMSEKKQICMLHVGLGDLDTFERLIKNGGDQTKLLQCFQAGIEHHSHLSSTLAAQYLDRCDRMQKDYVTDLSRRELIHTGLRLGSFLNDAGWYADAEKVLLSCRYVCLNTPMTTYVVRLTLECCQRLLHTQAAYCCFPGAAETYSLALRLLGSRDSDKSLDHSLDRSLKLPDTPVSKSTQTECVGNDADRLSEGVKECRLDAESAVTCKANESMNNLLIRLYREFSVFFFVRCDYNEAYRWSSEALKMLTPSTPPRMTVEVLRACGKACVVKRRFARAGHLLNAAEALACACGHATLLAHARLDLAFYLLNVDSIQKSVAVYEEALSTLVSVYGRGSLHTALAQEDLAYALYVLEYSSGRFYKARAHAERAINTIQELVPSDHLLLASAKRVKALILEEIALDNHGGRDVGEPKLLQESEQLHKAALSLSILAFGEKNVQTAKHYGNLGRLYQSMHRFQDAEEMHLRAIAIKEELLGGDDYEVGLSIGHLASLYNYHMQQHEQAEKLYFRSISISLKLFGEKYSGLEYDYRGLVHVFMELKKHDRAAHYIDILQHWHDLRQQSEGEQEEQKHDQWPISIQLIKQQFFDPNVD